MSANVDQRSKGQPNQVSNGSGKDVAKEEDPYLQPPVHSMRSWSEQASDSPYGAPPMSNAGVSDSFFQNYYASNMTYPFMNQGMSGSEGPWSNGADTMFGMGYDYSSMYGGFGFPPFSNWEYASEYWGSSQPQRKDQRGGYPPHQEDPYYHPPEMIPADTYGMMTNGVAPVPPEPQEPIGTVEHGIRGITIGGGGPHMPSSSSMADSSSNRKKMMDLSHQPPNMTDGFGGSGHHHHHADSSHLMMQHPPPLTHSQPPQSQPSSSMMVAGSTNNAGGGDSSSVAHSQPKKTSWAAIASQPARTQQQLRPRTIPRAPVNPNKPHSGNMDIGTWDNRGGNVAGKLPVQALQPPPSVSQAPPPPRVQSWAASSAPPPRATRQVGPPPASSSNSSNSPPGSGASINSNMNNSSSGSDTGNNSSSGAPGPSANAHPSSTGYSNYSSGSGTSSGHNGGSGGSNNTSNSHTSSSATMNGSHMSSGGTSRDSQQVGGSANSSAAAPSPVLDQLKFNNYNPKDFNLNPKSARFFIIKSYSEDDIHRSIKYNIWCSTEHGNKRLDAAFREREGKGPVYLIYSVNGSGHFCGIAQMMSPVDYNTSAGVWAQDKWKGQFTVKWVYVKDVPNNQLRHIRLENNENKPVTNSRDTQEVPAEKGKQVLRILHGYKHFTSIFDDFVHYEKRQQEDAANASAPSSHQHGHQQHRGNNSGDHRGDGRGDHKDHRDRGDGMGGRNRDNRRGGYDMGGRGGHDHRDGGRGHDHRGGGHHDGSGRGGRH